MKRRYTWIPDLPDHRDLKLTAPPARLLPRSTDLTAKFQPAYDQLDLGSCVGNACDGFMEYNSRLAGKPTQFSRLGIYYEARKLEGTVRQDSGCAIRDAVKQLAKVGAAEERLWPYVVANFAKAPTKAALANAATHRIARYQRIETLDAVKGALASGNPVVFGFTVYESFESASVARSGVVNMPTAKERALGGHAVLAVGYDDATQRVLVRNSWGASWGMKTAGGRGYFTMPYAYVQDRDLSDDFWQISV
jgi:C1A family cysteine protease